MIFFCSRCSLDIFHYKLGFDLAAFSIVQCSHKVEFPNPNLDFSSFLLLFLKFLCKQGHIAQNAHLFSYPTPILFFFVDKNLYKLSWRSSVGLCEKRYWHIHAVKVGFLLKFLCFRGYSLEKIQCKCALKFIIMIYKQ